MILGVPILKHFRVLKNHQMPKWAYIKLHEASISRLYMVFNDNGILFSYKCNL